MDDFWNGQKKIVLMDANLLACRERERILKRLAQTRAQVDFSQGLDIRLTEGIVPLIDAVRTKTLHFAWDNPEQDLTRYFRDFKEKYHKKDVRCLSVYVLVNYNSTMEQDLYRIYKLRELGYEPFVMIYDKAHADHELKRMMRWVNNKFVFHQVERFEEYDTKVKK